MLTVTQMPLSLKLIEVGSVDVLTVHSSSRRDRPKSEVKKYIHSKEFDIDMARLFEKAGRWRELTTKTYSHVLLLQVSLDYIPT